MVWSFWIFCVWEGARAVAQRLEHPNFSSEIFVFPAREQHIVGATPKGGLVRGYDKPIHGSFTIYFPAAILYDMTCILLYSYPSYNDVKQVTPTGAIFGKGTRSGWLNISTNLMTWTSRWQILKSILVVFLHCFTSSKMQLLPDYTRDMLFSTAWLKGPPTSKMWFIYTHIHIYWFGQFPHFASSPWNTVRQDSDGEDAKFWGEVSNTLHLEHTWCGPQIGWEWKACQQNMASYDVVVFETQPEIQFGYPKTTRSEEILYLSKPSSFSIYMFRFQGTWFIIIPLHLRL